MRLLVVALVTMTSSAFADGRDDARARFEQGQINYNLGKLDEAIVEFDAAYKLDPDPAYLFNLAQAYRLKANTERALFFYRRYIELKPDAPNLSDVRERIAALTEKLAADKALAKALADKTAAEKLAADKTAALLAVQPTIPRPRRLRLGVELGASRVFFNGLTFEEKNHVGARLRAAYIKRFGKLSLDLGGSYNLTTVSYLAQTEQQVAAYYEIYGTVAADYPLVGPLHVQLSVGVGVTSLSQVENGNSFTTGMARSDGVAMIAGEAQVSVAIRLDPAFDLVIAPLGVSVARAGGDLDERVSSVVRTAVFFLGARLHR